MKISMLRSKCKFGGLYRVGSCEVLQTQSGKKYARITLEDMSGQITAYLWENQYKGPWSFQDYAIVELSGSTRAFNGKWIVDAHTICFPDSIKGSATELLPYSQCHAPWLLDELKGIEEMITNKNLKEFLQSILLDAAVSIPFITVPASKSHHHSGPGGLLRHSIECAQIAAAIPMLAGENRELAIVGALLHDIGKIWVFDQDRRKQTGYLVDHQALTLEVCSRHLRELNHSWQDGADALRHILTCRTIKRWGYEPRMAIAHVVQLADKVSTEIDLEHSAFEGLSQTRSVSNPKREGGSYWRPSLRLTD